MQRHVMIAVLTYSGNPPFQVQDAITEALFVLLQRGDQVEKKTYGGASMLPKARNAIVSDFLASEATDLLMIDDDNYCSGADLVKLLDADADLVGAPIRIKLESGEIKWNVGLLRDRALRRRPDGLVEVDTIGTGIVRFSRACLQSMCGHADWYHDETAAGGRAHSIFEYVIKDHILSGEDVTCCNRWRALGGQVLMYPDIATHHLGRQDFAGAYSSWISEQPANLTVIGVDGEGAAVANYFALPLEPVAIALCIASRGRPNLVAKTVGMSLERAASEVDCVVALDADDPSGARGVKAECDVSIADREDTLGAKYNRCHSLAPTADLFVAGTDDCAIATHGWDEHLAAAYRRLPDGIGVIAFGTMPMASSLPAMYAVTRKFIEKVGYFQPPYFPTWFHDTWTDEIARMIGRRVWVPGIEVAYPELETAGKSRGIREITFWARFFEDTRPMRRAIAESIIADPEFVAPASQRAALLAGIDYQTPIFAQRNALLLDPDQAARIEQQVSFDAPADARYQRAKVQALSILKSLAPAGAKQECVA